MGQLRPQVGGTVASVPDLQSDEVFQAPVFLHGLLWAHTEGLGGHRLGHDQVVGGLDHVAVHHVHELLRGRVHLPGLQGLVGFVPVHVQATQLRGGPRGLALVEGILRRLLVRLERTWLEPVQEAGDPSDGIGGHLPLLAEAPMTVTRVKQFLA